VTTKADKIRALVSEGFSPQQIARVLDISAQHVRTAIWHDKHRERRRQHALKWLRKARQRESYRAWERAAQREYYAAKKQASASQ
jgi:DNA-binding CsgD family transcriptional regulator